MLPVKERKRNFTIPAFRQTNSSETLVLNAPRISIIGCKSPFDAGFQPVA